MKCKFFRRVSLGLLFIDCSLSSIAKLVLERVQSNIRSNSLLKAVGGLTLAYGAGAYDEIYSRAAALTELVAQPNFLEPQLAQVVKGMVDSFLGEQAIFYTILWSSLIAIQLPSVIARFCCFREPIPRCLLISPKCTLVCPLIV